MFRALIVTDPMCSWCWGMSTAVEEAAHELREEVEFDLLLGGINTHATQRIGDYGQRLLMKIWREVHAVTGQDFGFRLPPDFVYNSTLPCVALEAIRRRTGAAPFGFLHRLQQALFVNGENINDPQVLDNIAFEFGWKSGELIPELTDSDLLERVRDTFAGARSYGTHALPAVLTEHRDRRQLLLGGYADSGMLIELLRAARTRSME